VKIFYLYPTRSKFILSIITKKEVFCLGYYLMTVLLVVYLFVLIFTLFQAEQVSQQWFILTTPKNLNPTCQSLFLTK